MLNTILQKRTSKKVIHIFCCHDSRRRRLTGGAANQITEYTRLMKTPEMSSFNAQWEKLFRGYLVTVDCRRESANVPVCEKQAK